MNQMQAGKAVTMKEKKAAAAANSVPNEGVHGTLQADSRGMKKITKI